MLPNELSAATELLNNLSEEERNVTIKILQQLSTTGSSDLLAQLKAADFDEIPVDITTFLHDRRYLGNGLYDSDGRFTVFKFWEQTLLDIFPDNVTTKYNNIVLTGAIGLGKSFVAVIILLYLLYRLLCLKDPYAYYGMQPIDKLTISLMNITLDNARGVALDKMNQLLLASPWFMEHGEMHGSTNLRYVADKHIEVICASSNNQIIGRALFANFTDEVNFSLSNNPERQKAKMMKLITQIDARMKSRFLRGTYLPTVNIIASSKDTEQSFLESYIDEKRQNESTNTLIIDQPQWVVDDRKDSAIKFWVAVGNKMLPNELMPLDVTIETVDSYKAKGYDMWQVPIGYLDTFQQNLDEAICSIIGKATANSLKFISGTKLCLAKSNSYKNPFMKDIIEVGDDKLDLKQYADFFDLSRVDPADFGRPMFIHLDMSSGQKGKGDKTGIAGVVITGRETNIKALSKVDEVAMQALYGKTNAAPDLAPANLDLSDSQDLHYKVVFSVSVKAPPGHEISFAKNRNFVRWLRERGFAIKAVTADTFQSTAVRQDLKTDGFETDIVSVDRVVRDGNNKPICLPYYYLKSAIYDRRLLIYDKCELLTKELLDLEKHADGHIDHPQNGSKDQSDAVCGALWAASLYSEEYSYSEEEHWDAALEANAESAEAAKERMITQFDQEMMETSLLNVNPYMQTVQQEQQEAIKQQQEDLKYFADLANGIIII